MGMLPVIVMLVVIVVASGFYALVSRGHDLYLGRACQGLRWRRAFPRAPKREIRAFLRLFAEAFAIKSKHMLLVAPQDELLQLYRARYPFRGAPDSMEFETLARRVRETFGLNFNSLWHDHLTVGELFAQVAAAQQIAPADRHPATRAAGG